MAVELTTDESQEWNHWGLQAAYQVCQVVNQIACVLSSSIMHACSRFFFEIELLRSAPCPLPGGVRGVCCPHILVLRFQLQLNCHIFEWLKCRYHNSQGARGRRGSMAKRLPKQHHLSPKTPKCGYSQYQVHQRKI